MASSSKFTALLFLLLLSAEAFANSLSFRAIARLVETECGSEAAALVRRLEQFRNPELESQIRRAFSESNVTPNASGILALNGAERQALGRTVGALVSPGVEFVSASARSGSSGAVAFVATPLPRVRYLSTQSGNRAFTFSLEELISGDIPVEVAYRFNGQLTTTRGHIGRTVRAEGRQVGIEIHAPTGEKKVVPIPAIESVQPLEQLDSYTRVERLPLSELVGKRVRVTWRDSQFRVTMTADATLVSQVTDRLGQSRIVFEWYDVPTGAMDRMDLGLWEIAKFEAL